MKEAEKISHIHSSQVSETGSDTKINALTFGKLQDKIFFQLFQFYTMITT